MKTGLHPILHPVIFVDSSNGTEFVTISTLTSDKTKKVKGVDHYVIAIDISSASHPFYTGEKMLLDTAGRVDKFKQRMAAAEKLKEGHQKAQVKKLAKQVESLEQKVTRKAQEKASLKEQEKAAKLKPKKKELAEKKPEEKAEEKEIS